MNIRIFKKRSGVVLQMLLILCFSVSAFSSENGSSLLVDTTFVKDKIGKPDWVIVDMRFPAEYAEGHIPGAVLLPGWISKIFAEDTKRSSTVLPRLEKNFGEMGISNTSHVIVYGAVSRTSWNGVMFWVLELSGCNSSPATCTVQFYDGGIDRWQEEGGELEQKETKAVARTFKMASVAGRGVNGDSLMAIVENVEDAIIIDTRTAGEYDGTDIRALRGGHMPKAVNIDYAKNFNPETYRLLTIDELQLLYKDISLDSRIVTHCQTGQRAAYAYLVLRVLGYNNVGIYHDGWRVYGSNLNLPVESETWFDFTKVNSTMKAVQELQSEMK